jgi:uncharacterized protein (TIGR03435 family)
MNAVRFVFAVLVLFCNSLPAQTPAKSAFEVASIKPLPSLQALIADLQSGKLAVASLAMRIDGARVDIGATTMSSLISVAYKVKPHQILGPDWMTSQLYEIHAALPEGASKDQVPEMVQTLLAERFKLKAHQEKKEQPVYALIVGKSGPKLKDAIETPATPPTVGDPSKPASKPENPGKELLSVDTGNGQMKVRQEGQGIVISEGGTRRMRMTMGENGAIRMEIDKVKMSEFADMLTQYIDRPVIDMTELTGAYQVSLDLSRDEILNIARRVMPDLPIPAASGGLGGAAPATGLAGSGASDPSGGAIFQAVQQLGLKLDSRKAPVDTIIIDSVEKNPTEN